MEVINGFSLFNQVDCLKSSGIYTMHGAMDGLVIPVAYILMPDCMRITYKNAFKSVTFTLIKYKYFKLSGDVFQR